MCRKPIYLLAVHAEAVLIRAGLDQSAARAHIEELPQRFVGHWWRVRRSDLAKAIHSIRNQHKVENPTFGGLDCDLL